MTVRTRRLFVNQRSHRGTQADTEVTSLYTLSSKGRRKKSPLCRVRKTSERSASRVRYQTRLSTTLKDAGPSSRHVRLVAAAEAEHEVEGRLLLDVVVRQGAAILELLAGEDQALLVGRDA